MFFKNQTKHRYTILFLSTIILGIGHIAFISSAHATGTGVSVVVTEKIPGATCSVINDKGVTTKKYRCYVQSGFGSVIALFGSLIKYATFVTALLGVLMIVFSGFQYATSAGDTKQQSSAVQRIQKLIGGLVLLFLMGLILNTVAPWIYR